LIEWPEHGAWAAPPADLLVRLDHAAAVRDVRLEALTEHGCRWLSHLTAA
jgi:tRNA A37 threonylcarbamoyladenosine biosynthesis protein TsaE